MSLQFSVYQPNTLVSEGKVSDLCDSIRFTGEKNLKSTSRVAVVLQKDDGTSKVVACSEPVSSSVRSALAKGRSKQEVLGVIASLNILLCGKDQDVPMISAPAGAGSVETAFRITDLKSEISYEKLLTF